MADPALEIDSLVYRYGGADGFDLKAAGLRLEAGQETLIVGPSGCGKSTLLHLVAGLAEPASGTVRVAGRNMHALKGPERDAYRAVHLGMVFQTHHLLHGFTALENVMMALAFTKKIPRTEHEPRARELLTRLGIDRPAATPDRLSVGQQQRVAIARALAAGPDLVLADEPTASLDPPRAAEAIDLLREACAERNAALLCVSHDPMLVDRFDRVESLGDLSGINAESAEVR